jgi:hypothetical protein
MTLYELDELLTGIDATADPEAASGALLRSRIRGACMVAAENVRANSGAATSQEIQFARGVFRNVHSVAEQMVPAILGRHNDTTVAAVLGVTKEQMVAAVTAAIPTLMA